MPVRKVEPAIYALSYSENHGRGGSINDRRLSLPVWRQKSRLSLQHVIFFLPQDGRLLAVSSRAERQRELWSLSLLKEVGSALGPPSHVALAMSQDLPSNCHHRVLGLHQEHAGDTTFSLHHSAPQCRSKGRSSEPSGAGVLES